MKLRKAWEITTPTGGTVIVPVSTSIEAHGEKHHHMNITWLAALDSNLPGFTKRRVFVLK